MVCHVTSSLKVISIIFKSFNTGILLFKQPRQIELMKLERDLQSKIETSTFLIKGLCKVLTDMLYWMMLYIIIIN